MYPGRIVKAFFIALSFLTIAPLKIKHTEKELIESVYFFPFVGLLLGGVAFIFCKTFYKKPFFASFTIVLLWCTLTGALHLDGVADVADALRKKGEEAIKIMKDKSIGTFGALSIFFLLSLKIYSIQTLLPQKTVAVLIAPFLARGAMILVALLSKGAKDEGLGNLFANSVKIFHILPSAFLLFILMYFFRFCIIPSIFVLSWSIALSIFFNAWIGGVTGDCLGAVCESAETLFLLACTFV